MAQHHSVPIYGFEEHLPVRVRPATPRAYIACGARLGWLVDLDAGCAWVYRPGAPAETIEGATTLRGDPELPGFVLDLAALAAL